MTKSHEIDYTIHGDDLQFVEIELDPGETVIAEAGAMVFMEDGIAFETKLGDGSAPDQGLMSKLGGAAMRAFTQESLFMTHITHQGNGRARVAFGAAYPGKVVSIDLADLGKPLLCQKDAFLCAALGTRIAAAFHKKIGTGLFGGEGFVLQKLEGTGLPSSMPAARLSRNSLMVRNSASTLAALSLLKRVSTIRSSAQAT